MTGPQHLAHHSVSVPHHEELTCVVAVSLCFEDHRETAPVDCVEIGEVDDDHPVRHLPERTSKLPCATAVERSREPQHVDTLVRSDAHGEAVSGGHCALCHG